LTSADGIIGTRRVGLADFEVLLPGVFEPVWAHLQRELVTDETRQ
jgi:hypothetical protein